MKKVKKLLMALALCSISLVAVGCSSKDDNNNNNNNNTNNTEKKEDTIKKADISIGELSNKMSEASKTIKNLKLKLNNKSTSDIFGKGITINLETEITASTDPVLVKLEGKTIMGEHSSDYKMYFSGDEMFFYSSMTKEWAKVPNGKFKEVFKKQKDIGNLDDIPEILKIIEKDTVVTEEGSNYIISYSGNDETAKQALFKAALSAQPTLENSFKNMQIEKFELKYVIDKNTFYPVEILSVIKGNIKGDKEGMSFDAESKTTFSDINQVKGFTIPDEVKNAKEMNLNGK